MDWETLVTTVRSTYATQLDIVIVVPGWWAIPKG